MSSGGMSVTDSIVSDLDIDNSYGDITVSLLGKQQDYIIDVTSSYSTTIIDDIIYDKGIYIDKGGSGNITIASQSGKISLAFTE